MLREIAKIYRENIRSDSALVTVLSQIIALDANDAAAVRELARVYEALGRWRDLLTTQMRLAELEPDNDVKAELYRAAGRRFLDGLDPRAALFDLAGAAAEWQRAFADLRARVLPFAPPAPPAPPARAGRRG